MTFNEETGTGNWALIDLMGHTRYAGLLSLHIFGSASLLRVDIPEITTQDGCGETQTIEAQTITFNPNAIHSIKYVSEETALMVAKQIKVRPISEYDIRRDAENLVADLIGKGKLQRIEAPKEVVEDDDDFAPGYDDDDDGY